MSLAKLWTDACGFVGAYTIGRWVGNRISPFIVPVVVPWVMAIRTWWTRKR